MLSSANRSNVSIDSCKILEKEDRAKLTLLEARLSSNGSNKDGVTCVGFDSPIPSNSYSGYMMSQVESSLSNGSDPRFGNAASSVPGSPVRQSALNYNPKKRKFPPVQSEFSREDDTTIMNVVLFERSLPTWKVLSEKLGKDEDVIKARYRELMDKASHIDSTDRRNFAQDLFARNNSSSQDAISLHSNSDQGNSNGHETAVRTSTSSSSSSATKRNASPTVASNSSLRNALKNQPQIKCFFAPKTPDEGVKAYKQRSASSSSSISSAAKKAFATPPSAKQKVTTSPNEFHCTDGVSKDREFSELQRKLQACEAELKREVSGREVLAMQTKELQDALIQTQQDLEVRKSRMAEVLESFIRERDSQMHNFHLKRVTEDTFRLGKITIVKTGFGPRTKISEQWEDGDAFHKLKRDDLQLIRRREDLEKEKKRVLKLVRSRNKGRETSRDSYPDLEDAEAEEAVKAELSNLKRQEQEQAEKRAALDREKVYFIKLTQRLREEAVSRFNRLPVLNNRYLLRELLGKGGFSEVWRGYDLIELRDVAVKVHELNSSWNEQKRACYLKHATREYRIHLNLIHPKIVQLFDVFEIDSTAFATVLEYCEGDNLETLLKYRKTLPEREARSILLQILCGLRYLNCGDSKQSDSDSSSSSTSSGSKNAMVSPSVLEDRETRSRQKTSIIHYDLKPGNILFDGNGGVKITDFGLSKIVEPSDMESTGIELTSPGAGTYWYLPPECFATGPGRAPPKISSKVDVWSVGVIFYQILYGARPFGEGMTQENVLHNGTMLNARSVSFPSKPVVSKEAQKFISKCLTYNQAYRPDVKTLCQDEYLRQKKV